MIKLLVGEGRDHVSITDERDCLSPDVIRIEERIFPWDTDVMNCAKAYERRGFRVSVQYGDFEYFTSDGDLFPGTR